jgi:hypothetical protein
VAVRIATGDGGPDRVYEFSHQLGYDPRHLVMFEHVEGATFCEVRGGCVVRTSTSYRLVLLEYVEGAAFCEVRG